MGFRDRLGKMFSRRSPEEKVLGQSDTLSRFVRLGYGGGSADTASQAISLYRESSVVSVPVNWIAESFASIVPVLEVDGEIQKTSPVIEFLAQPSANYTAKLFWETLAKYYLITGEVGVVGAGVVQNPPLELQPISPKELRLTASSQGFTPGWTISGPIYGGDYLAKPITASEIRYFRDPITELWHIRNFNPLNHSLGRGESPLLAVSAEITQHILGNQHNVSLLEHGGKVSLIFHFKQNMKQEVFDENKKRVLAAYEGPTKVGGIAVTSGEDLDIKEMGLTARDMDWRGIMDSARLATALEYRVPLPLVFPAAETFSNYETAKPALYDDAVLPLADRIYGPMGEFLLPRYKIDPRRARITYDKVQIPALRSRSLDELKKLREISIHSDNEMRSTIGAESYEGGDLHLKQSSLVPAADLADPTGGVEPFED